MSQNLRSVNGKAVHAPAYASQEENNVTSQFACAPMGVNGMHGFHDYYWTTQPVTCKRCIKAQARKEA